VGARAAPTVTDPAPGTGRVPRTVRVLAVIVGIEAVGVLVASILAGIDTGTGQSYHRASGVAITVIGVATAAALMLVARALRAGRRWTRTPTLLTQLFAAIVGIYLVQGHRYDWGIPALLLTAAGFAMLMAPTSVELLTPGRVRKPGQP
jgi:peptidoglycan/LPS O-acetylase OafA/YrhL